MTPSAKTNSREEQAIQSRIDSFVSAWNAHDIRVMAGVFAEDGDLINPFGRAAKTRPEIEKLIREEHTGPLKNSRMSLTTEGIRLLDTDVAVSDHAFEVAGMTDPAGNRATVAGHLTIVHRRRGDAWEVVASRPMIPAARPGV